MATIFGIPDSLLFGQLLLGLINGGFYALLSLGLAVIFGLLRVVNFVHGALFMLGALVAWMLMRLAGLDYWWALLLSPLALGLFGVVLEKLVIRPVYRLDHTYALLLTFGLTLMIQGTCRNLLISPELDYPVPRALTGAVKLGFMILPIYRGWVVAVALVTSLATWIAIEKTPLGATLRATTENPALVQAFGINVPRLLTLTYAAAGALAAFAGVLAAPIYSVNPNMGDSFITVVFAVVVIGGMGSILGSVVTGFGLGVIEGLTKVFYAQASSTIIFFAMIVVLLVRPTGLFGKTV